MSQARQSSNQVADSERLTALLNNAPISDIPSEVRLSRPVSTVSPGPRSPTSQSSSRRRTVLEIETDIQKDIAMLKEDEKALSRASRASGSRASGSRASGSRASGSRTSGSRQRPVTLESDIAKQYSEAAEAQEIAEMASEYGELDIAKRASALSSRLSSQARAAERDSMGGSVRSQAEIRASRDSRSSSTPKSPRELELEDAIRVDRQSRMQNSAISPRASAMDVAPRSPSMPRSPRAPTMIVPPRASAMSVAPRSPSMPRSPRASAMSVAPRSPSAYIGPVPERGQSMSFERSPRSLSAYIGPVPERSQSMSFERSPRSISSFGPMSGRNTVDRPSYSGKSGVVRQSSQNNEFVRRIEPISPRLSSQAVSPRLSGRESMVRSPRFSSQVSPRLSGRESMIRSTRDGEPLFDFVENDVNKVSSTPSYFEQTVSSSCRFAPSRKSNMQ